MKKSSIWLIFTIVMVSIVSFLPIRNTEAQTSSKIILSNASTSLGSPIINNGVVAYPYNMTVTITNNNDFAIFIKNKNMGSDITAVIQPSVASVKYNRTFIPETSSGDSADSKIIPSRVSRIMKISGTLYNPEPASLLTYGITSLIYGTSTSNLEAYSITSGLEPLSVSVTSGTVPPPVTNTNCYNFTVNLTIGSTGPDVVALQTLLIAKGYNIPDISSGIVAKGYYGQSTAVAVSAFQAANGISNTGFVGPLTRAVLNALCTNPVAVVNVNSTLSNTSATAVLNDNGSQAPTSATITFTFTLTAPRNSDVFLRKVFPGYLTTQVGATANANLSSASPAILAGDTRDVYIIPADTSRVFTYVGTLDNSKGVSGLVSASVNSIYYGTNTSNVDTLRITSGLERLKTPPVGLVGNSTNPPIGVPTLNVLSPVGNRTYLFGSTIQLVWNTQNVDADYYYALLENKAIKNLGVVITKDLPKTSTGSSFVFSKNLVDTIVANSGGLNEGQLKDGYYVRVIGIKKGLLYNSAVVNGVSGVFSVSTIENSKGVTVNNTSATITPVDNGANKPVAYAISFTFILNNQKEEDIYVSKTTANVLTLNAENRPSIVNLSNVYASLPATVAGDADKVFVIPAGTSRAFTVNGIIKNDGGTSGLKDIKVTGISYINFGKNPDPGIIKEGLEKLRVTVAMDGAKEDNSLVVRNASARLGTAILKGNDVYGYNYDMFLTIDNNSKSDIYMNKKGDGTDLNAIVNPDVASVKYIKVWSPDILAGDTSSTVIIPSGSSRIMKITGQITNIGKPTSVIYKITGLNYGLKSNNPKGLSITAGLENLRISPNFSEKVDSIIPITVLSPKGGEAFNIGQTMNVRWSTGGGSGTEYVSLILRNIATDKNLPQDSGSQAQLVINDGNYTWKIGNIPRGQYTLRIACEPVSGCPIADSAPFNIGIPIPTTTSTPTPTSSYSPSIKIISPNGNESYTQGSQMRVLWNTVGIPESANLDVFRLRNESTGQEYNLSFNVQNLAFTVVNIPSSVPVGKYKLEIKTIVNGRTVTDSSDYSFAVISPVSPIPTPTTTSTPTPSVYVTPSPTPYVTPVTTSTPTPSVYVTPSPTPYVTPVTTSTPTPSSTPSSSPQPTPSSTPSSSPQPSTSPTAMDDASLQASIWQAIAEWFMGRQ